MTAKTRVGGLGTGDEKTVSSAACDSGLEWTAGSSDSAATERGEEPTGEEENDELRRVCVLERSVRVLSADDTQAAGEAHPST